MAIQHIVPIILSLLGDGTSTTFTFRIRDLYALTLNGPTVLVNANTTPSAAVFNNSDFGSAQVSILGGDRLKVEFATAPGNGSQGQISLSFLFASE